MNLLRKKLPFGSRDRQIPDKEPRLQLRYSDKDTSTLTFFDGSKTIEVTAENHSELGRTEIFILVPLTNWMLVSSPIATSRKVSSWSGASFSDAELIEFANSISSILTARRIDHVIVKRGPLVEIPFEARSAILESYRGWMQEMGWRVTYDLSNRTMRQEIIDGDINGFADRSVSTSAETIRRNRQAHCAFSGKYLTESVLAKTLGITYTSPQNILFSSDEASNLGSSR